jgi:hypothetical protein
VERNVARRLAFALRNELWFSASDELLERLAERGGLNIGLNPPEETEDEDLTELVWPALRAIGLANGE